MLPTSPCRPPSRTSRAGAASYKLREDRYNHQVAMGLIDKNWPLSPRQPQVPAWDSLTPDRYDHIMAIYTPVITRMDAAVGRLVDGLQKRGDLDNTVIMFMSDNGGNAESGINGRLEGDHPGDAQSTVFIGQGWATLNNTPFVRIRPADRPGPARERLPDLAIRDGDWKLLCREDGAHPELYNLTTDAREKNNVASEHPDIVARLTRQVVAWRKTLPVPTLPTGALPGAPAPGTTSE